MSTLKYTSTEIDLKVTTSFCIETNNSLDNKTLTEYEQFTKLQSILIAIFAGILAFLTLGGNLLVMISFGINKKLRILNNYFLASLSVADFAIGLISMPLYTVYVVLGYWPFSSLPCDLWLSMDYVMSNSSALHLVIICVDRYFSVKRPLTYRANRTSKKVVRMIISVWVISSLLWIPLIFAMPYIEGERTVPDTDCYIQFLYSNAYVTITTHILAFWLPVFIMIAFYQRVYNAALEHAAFKSKYACRTDAPAIKATYNCRGKLDRHASIDSTVSTISGVSYRNGGKPHPDREGDKAARTLTAILLAFIITWTPYHVNVTGYATSTAQLIRSCMPYAT
ncbi:muscarinic acetylcholine receptor M3 [Mytilus galloprovincialis]|uniref:Muscarinic acetylcholine receptor M3 n=1 Tax=Mytilus galloprovincialis TaxID=29158 RepID=A0A8B6DCP8_MYTGA|nr:muscarinic acetylcholine receptor M3 [Mytilus galloprovincialis]